MRALIEREKAINIYFRDGKGYKIVAKELGIPLDTVKSWVRRYRIDHGEPESGEARRIKVIKEYKPREKTPEMSDKERIEKLEMEVELLRTFLLAVFTECRAVAIMNGRNVKPHRQKILSLYL